VSISNKLSIVTMLWATCSRNFGLIPGWGNSFSLQNVQINTVVHPASTQWVPGNLTGKKVARGMNGNSIPFRAEFKNECSYIFNPPNNGDGTPQNPLTLYSMHKDPPLPKAICMSTGNKTAICNN